MQLMVHPESFIMESLNGIQAVLREDGYDITGMPTLNPADSLYIRIIGTATKTVFKSLRDISIGKSAIPFDETVAFPLSKGIYVSDLAGYMYQLTMSQGSPLTVPFIFVTDFSNKFAIFPGGGSITCTQFEITSIFVHIYHQQSLITNTDEAYVRDIVLYNQSPFPATLANTLSVSEFSGAVSLDVNLLIINGETEIVRWFAGGDGKLHASYYGSADRALIADPNGTEITGANVSAIYKLSGELSSAGNYAKTISGQPDANVIDFISRLRQVDSGNAALSLKLATS